MGNSNAMNFDRMARVYATLEWLMFGGALCRTRVEYLESFHNVKEALVLGDGDGRFTAALVRRFQRIELTAVDSSMAMLQRTRERLNTAEQVRVWMVCGDVRRLPLTNGSLAKCNAVVTHFLLDCLDQSETEEFVQFVTTQVGEGCRWIISEFAVPHREPWRSAGRRLIRLLYWGTRFMTGLHINKIPDYARALEIAGWRCSTETTRWRGLLRAEVWERV